MRQTEHVSDQPIVIVQAHVELLDHRRREQRLGFRRRLRTAGIDKDHMATRQKFGIRSVHRVQRGDFTTCITQRGQSLAQWRLQRADVEDQAGRLQFGEVLQNPA